jgi:hypothetical protein
MFVIKGAAEIKNINVRAEVHGDSLVRAIDVKLAITDVDAKQLGSAIPGLMELFWEGEQPRAQEIYPLKVRHTIENVTATISVGRKTVKLAGADVRKVHITPKFGHLCEMLLSIRCAEIGDGLLDPLHKWLKGTVEVEIVERQLRLAGMEQDEGKDQEKDQEKGREKTDGKV